MIELRITRCDRQRLRNKDSNKMVELVEREAERTEAEHTNILRWEDDGGQAIEYGDRADRLNPEPAQRNNQPMALPSTGKKDSLHASQVTATWS